MRYLSTRRTGHFRVLDPKIGQILLCRAADYRPYHPHYDPMRFNTHALTLNEGHKRNFNLHYVVPRMASHVSPQPAPDKRSVQLLVSSLLAPPKSLLDARRQRFAAQ